MSDWGMSLDELNRRQEVKEQKFDANVQLLEAELLACEDLMADFDSLIVELEQDTGYGMDKLQVIRDRVYEKLLGPAGPSREEPVVMKVGDV